MGTEYAGIVFHSEHDLTVGYNLSAIEKKLNHFNPNEQYTDINEIIEFYNIQKYFKFELYLTSWSDDVVRNYREICKKLSGIIGRFFSQIDSDNFAGYYSNVSFSYKHDFWEIINDNKIYKNISSEALLSFLESNETVVHMILRNKNIVRHFDRELSEFMKITPQCAEIVVEQLLMESKDERSYILPDSLSVQDKEALFVLYIQSDDANPNYLQLIERAQSSSKLILSDRTRLLAKREYNKYIEACANRNEGFEYGASVTFLPGVSKCEYNNGFMDEVYDKNWLTDNLDYPTLLNNFIYLFGFVDSHMRCMFLSRRSQISVLESAIFSKGKNEYLYGFTFDFEKMLYSMRMMAYYNELNRLNVRLEDVFKWFFEVYLKEEFNIEGYTYNAPSSHTTYLEKMRLISTEIDSVLKQYRMLCTEQCIDRELLEMSSEHIRFGDIPSMIRNKYAYGIGKALKNEQNSLFSNQSLIRYTEKFECKYSSFYDLIKHEKVFITDFCDYQNPEINRLIERGTIKINDDGSIYFDRNRVSLLYHLYDHEVLCVSHCKSLADLMEKLQKSNELEYENTLFSRTEQDYLDFMLNKSKYSNGFDLRNKYIHGTNSLNIDEHEADYIEMLKIMALIIIKINEELCHKSAMEE